MTPVFEPVALLEVLVTARPSRLAGLGLAIALAVVPLGGSTALAAGSPGRHQAQHGNKGKKPVKFVAVGTITAVDSTAATVTVADRGGSRDLHNTSVTIAVPSTARIERDDATASLADLRVGDQAAVAGTRTAGYTATRVNAESADPDGGTGDPGGDGPSPTDPAAPAGW